MKVKFRETGEEVMIYGVRKSGPANDGSQTKFLVCALGEWGWMPANRFVAVTTLLKQAYRSPITRWKDNLEKRSKDDPLQQ